MSETSTWRTVLGRILSDPQERQRLCEQLGVHPLTLSRWRDGQSTPRPATFRQLLAALPEDREQLIALYEAESTGSLAARDDTPLTIPSAFYGKVHQVSAMTPEQVRAWSLYVLILQQALFQLDPQRTGMELVVIRCMPPGRDSKIQSLREDVAVGTTPWRTDLIERKAADSRFHGAESLAGQVVSSGEWTIIQDYQDNDQGFAPPSKVPQSRCCAAYGLFRGGRIAGCLQVTCALPSYITPQRSHLLQQYTDLLTLAFERGDFYSLSQMDLRLLPPYQTQQPYLHRFYKRVSELQIESARTDVPLSKQQAEQVVWKEIEVSLLSVLSPPSHHEKRKALRKGNAS